MRVSFLLVGLVALGGERSVREVDDKSERLCGARGQHVDLVARVVDVAGKTVHRVDFVRHYGSRSMTALGSDLAADLEFNCPRCAQSVRERVYGPCGSCRDQLRTTVAGTARGIEAVEYTPKMNVTPNAVATKD